MRDLLDLITAAGFEGAAFAGKTGVATSRYTVGALFRARKPM